MARITQGRESGVSLPLDRLPWSARPLTRRVRRAMASAPTWPMVVWWGVLVGTFTFGSLLNVYMAYRVSEARIQLARLEQDYALREQINAELLYRIGAEANISHIQLWALRHDFTASLDTIWLEPGVPLVRTLAEAAPQTGGETESPPSPTERLTDTREGIRDLSFNLQARWRKWRLQMGSLSWLPPALSDSSQPAARGETQPLLRRWLEALRDAANATGS